MRVLVSGGAGFIGSHLCRRLLKNGHFVICIDRHIKTKTKRIKDLLNNNNFQVIENDLIKINNLKLGKINQIYHLASPTSRQKYLLKPEEVLWTNAQGTKNLLDLALKNKAKFLLASSAEIYGMTKKSIQDESDYGSTNPVGERSCYTEGKRFAESMCMAYFRSFKTQVKIVRFFNVYGPGMGINDGRSISNFICKCLKNKPVEIHGNGLQTRTFCYVSDAVDGMLAAMATDKAFTGPVNIGSKEAISIKALANRIIKYTASHSKIMFLSSRINDPLKRMPSLSIAKKILKFQPKIKLEEGLKETINYFRLLI